MGVYEYETIKNGVDGAVLYGVRKIIERVIVLDSDGETNYKYDYQHAYGIYFVDVYKETELWYSKELTESDFKQVLKAVNQQ